ncbi:ABC transporter substrate-binding protein [Clostridium cylindrosporum]|uniref:ABC-type Fe3+-hydroxamate transport system, periplasmic component n=1 Tax=Clostridium cylindrosporum DSM 605 TaxID=1121307 RepID=A0A0J8D6U1_CLOCY|nr:ABC transporter substrate-binding protein [Clostridium cylindrosporum]KMT21795.1 ABC-type Fe3+-hydroxamate transport system, periplasmic component [Clostridium cylindrosporum DSM 605]
MKGLAKRSLGLLVVATMMLSSLVGCTSTNKNEVKQTSVEQQKQNKETRTFVDSAGRSVEIPKEIKRVAPSGALAQIVLYSLSPDKIIGWSQEPSESVKKYMDEKYWKLPTFGQFYGKNVNLNIEALIKEKPEVIIDIGEKKKTVKQDMDGIQKQVGIPVIFIEATLDTMDKAYTTLGEILSEKDAAKVLSDYCTKSINEARGKSASIPMDKKLKVYYGEGDTGLETNPKGSIHADVIDLVGGINVADITTTKGTGGNQVTMEQILLWAPDRIILGPKSIYKSMGIDDRWKDLKAVKEGKYYEIPMGPYNWMGRPPSVNRLIGIKWLGNLLYPDIFNYDMVKETKEFYKLFYHYDLKDSDVKKLLSKSTFK